MKSKVFKQLLLGFLEQDKIFSAEWFEVCAYVLGKGRFAKGEKYYTYLSQTQMPRIIGFSPEQKFRAEAGCAAKQALKAPSSVILKRLYLSHAKCNALPKKSDFKDERYELDLHLKAKLYRRFQFQITGSKLVWQGRQQKKIQPAERLILSEPAHCLFPIDFSQTPGTPEYARSCI